MLFELKIGGELLGAVTADRYPTRMPILVAHKSRFA